MSAVKERIFGAVTVMSEVDAEKVWEMILNNIPSRSWENVEEVTPDEWDKKMLSDVKENPDCNEFISEEELMKELNLQEDSHE